jgi:hypothetical protein
MKIKRFSIINREEGILDIDKLKNNVISVLAARHIIDTSKGILEKNNINSIEDFLSKVNNKKDKENRREIKEEFSYEENPKIRKNSILIRKPEIRYRREDIKETPEMINKSVIKYPEEDED